MDFMSRMTPSQPQPARVPAPESVDPRNQERGSRRSNRKPDWLSLGSRIGTNIILLIVALLVAAVAWFIFSAQPASESNLVSSKHLQAVFLNTGQVYFGKIASINKDYLVLNGVYYLQSSNSGSSSSSSTANQNVSLVKLGCELHKPYDAMMVNLSQVTFWENLQDDGQVAKAVTQYQQQNPNGQKCSDQPASSSSNLQNQTTTNKQ